MGQFFMVSETFNYETLCFCETGEHKNLFTFSRGDIVEFKGECLYSESHGSFYLVFVNNIYHFYMSVEDIDHYFLKEHFVSVNDIKKWITQIKNDIDYSLDIGDKKLFMQYSKKLMEANAMLSDIENTIMAY